MKTASLLGATLVDEATAIAIIDYCLFGALPQRPTCSPLPHPRRAKRPRKPVPQKIHTVPTRCPLDDVVLWKHTSPKVTSQVTSAPAREIPTLWRPRAGLTFPDGLCYLNAVQEYNWPSAVVELGYYPAVVDLLNSPLVEKFSTFLVEQTPGLYHMDGSYSRGGMSLYSAKPSWKVGAHLPNRPHPGHNAGYPQRVIPDLQRSHPARGPPLPPQSMMAPATPLGVPTPKPRGHRPPKRGKAPFHPYASRNTDRRPSSPATQWKKALADPLEETMDSLKAELDIFPSTLAVPAWKDTQAWLKDAKKHKDFDRKGCIPALTEFFATVLNKVKSDYASIQEDERLHEETLAAESGKLVALLEQFKQVEAALESPTPGFDVAQARAHSRALTAQIQEQEKVVDLLDGGANPDETDMGDDPIADGASFVEVPEDAAPEKAPHPSAKDLWPESNYQNYAERVGPLFPAPTGKMPLDSLFVKMEEPVDSKLYLPRPLELYTVEELAKVVPKGLPRWNNRYEDPMEPAKSWTWSEFSQIYNAPGFHFMIARVAQVGPQYKDPKLSTLCAKLATRWRCAVTLQKMDPRQDWMLCTVPSDSDGEKEALKYDLVRLSEGNAVYVIRKFAPAGRARDLEWVVKGSLADDDTIYTQMRKRLLDFEMGDTRLGWRVLGVRKAGATSKFRGTFILDSASVYWPWSMDWGHKHGSVPDSSPLLNFEPTWSARRPYACQCCYSTDHFTEECPLPFMKVGGNSLVSQPARSLIIKKKAAERIISLDRSAWELPVPPAPGTPRVPPSPSRPLPKIPPTRKTIPLSIIEERSSRMDTDDASSAASDARLSIAAPPPVNDPPYQVVDTLVRFLTLQLAGSMTQGMGLTESKVQFLCKTHKGSLPVVLASLRRDGWLPTSVSDQVMSYEYGRFTEGASSLQAGGWCIPLLTQKSCFTDTHTSMTHYCPGSMPIPIQGAVHQVDPAGNAAATCTRNYCRVYTHLGT